MTFPETTWTILADATLNGGEKEKQALGEICERYRQPVDVVIRARGVPKDRVEDLRQDFFLSLIQTGFFRKAQRQKGKFRTYLLTALRNFLIDDLKKASAVKHGGGLVGEELLENSVSLEEDELRFDLAWAHSLFDAAIEVVEKKAIAKRGEERWRVLRPFLTGESQGMSYEELGQVLELSEGGAKSEVSRMRAKFREELRGQVRQTVNAPHEVDEELRFLREAMLKML